MNGKNVFDAHVHVQPWEMMRPAIAEKMRAGRNDLDRVRACMEKPAEFLKFMDDQGMEKAVLVNYVSEIMGFTEKVNEWVAKYCSEAPERLILFMLDNVDALRPVPARRWREEELDGLRVVMGTDSLAVHFDRITGRPVLIVTVTDDPVRGDLTTETAYHRWTPTNGVVLPRQVDVTANGRMLSVLVCPAKVMRTLFTPESVLMRSARFRVGRLDR